MKDYVFERVEFRGAITTRLEEHREIIWDYASQGYRFVGAIPVEEIGYGKLRAVDLVFEADIPDDN